MVCNFEFNGDEVGLFSIHMDSEWTSLSIKLYEWMRNFSDSSNAICGNYFSEWNFCLVYSVRWKADYGTNPEAVYDLFDKNKQIMILCNNFCLLHLNLHVNPDLMHCWIATQNVSVFVFASPSVIFPAPQA